MSDHRRNRRWLGGALLMALVSVGAAPAHGAAAPTITNLVSNPSVETNTAGWVAHNVGVSDSVADRSTAWAQSGADSMHYAGTSGSTTLSGTGITGVIGTFVLPASGAWGYPVSAGHPYTSSAWVNVVSAPPPGSPGVWEEIFFFDAAGRLLTQVNGPSLGLPVEPGVQRVFATGTAPATAVRIQVVTVMGSSAELTPMELYVDAAMITRGATLESYFDGSTRDGLRSYSWLGLANASASQSRALGTVR
jgi:hypothetical protein